MTCIRTTRDPVRTWQTRPNWQTAGRREAVHGRIVPKDEPEPRWWLVTRIAVMSLCVAYALKLTIVGG